MNNARRKGGTSSAVERRKREGFFDLYTNGYGIDIGAGGDPLLVAGCECIDKMPDKHRCRFKDVESIPDQTCDYIYSSHCLEHIPNPFDALRQWWRKIKYDGHLLLYLPHMDLYERKEDLPSRWNPSHKFYFSMVSYPEPHIVSAGEIADALPRKECDVVYIKKCDEGHVYDLGIKEHPYAEFSIEIVIKKIKQQKWRDHVETG